MNTSIGELVRTIVRLSDRQWQQMNWLQRWLVMIRAPVLLMTVCASLTGILLSVADGHFHMDRIVALLLGLALAHATNNLINDWIDHRQGIDKDNYFRRQYGVHVLEDGLVSEPLFLTITATTGLSALVFGIYLYLVSHEAVLYLTLTGAFFVLFYTWPLKHYGLGEISVLLVWGPLITAGSYYVLGSTVTWELIWVSLIAGIGPTLVIFGKHIDKLDQDVAKLIQTLPVIAGERLSRQLCLGLIAMQWLLIFLLAFTGRFWLLACLASAVSLHAFVHVLARTAPSERPDHYPENIWPLWYAAYAFRYTRDFMVSLLAGLVIRLVFF